MVGGHGADYLMGNNFKFHLRPINYKVDFPVGGGGRNGIAPCFTSFRKAIPKEGLHGFIFRGSIKITPKNDWII